MKDCSSNGDQSGILLLAEIAEIIEDLYLYLFSIY